MEQRFEKVNLYRSDTDQARGVLIAQGDSLRFESKKGMLLMPKVRGLSIVKNRLAVEYGEAGNYGTATFVNLGAGAFKWRAATKELEEKLRQILQMAPMTDADRQGLEAAHGVRRQAEGKRGRTQMWIGGVLAIAATIVTIVTYANADPGDTYFFWWGGIIFGLILFFQGLAASRSSRR